MSSYGVSPPVSAVAAAAMPKQQQQSQEQQQGQSQHQHQIVAHPISYYHPTPHYPSFHHHHHLIDIIIIKWTTAAEAAIAPSNSNTYELLQSISTHYHHRHQQ